MTESEKQQILDIIDGVKWGSVTIRKENGQITIIDEKHTRKLNLHRQRAQGEKNDRSD